MLNLGELPVENEKIDFTHSTNQNLLAHYHKVTINVVPNDDVDRNLPLFMRELNVEYINELRALIIKDHGRDAHFSALTRIANAP